MTSCCEASTAKYRKHEERKEIGVIINLEAQNENSASVISVIEQSDLLLQQDLRKTKERSGWIPAF